MPSKNIRILGFIGSITILLIILISTIIFNLDTTKNVEKNLDKYSENYYGSIREDIFKCNNTSVEYSEYNTTEDKLFNFYEIQNSTRELFINDISVNYYKTINDNISPYLSFSEKNKPEKFEFFEESYSTSPGKEYKEQSLLFLDKNKFSMADFDNLVNCSEFRSLIKKRNLQFNGLAINNELVKDEYFCNKNRLTYKFNGQVEYNSIRTNIFISEYENKLYIYNVGEKPENIDEVLQCMKDVGWFKNLKVNINGVEKN